MRTGRFFWKLFLGNAALLTIALAVSVLLMIREFDRFHEEELTPFLNHLGETLRLQTQERFDDVHAAWLAQIARAGGTDRSDDIRVTFVAADGRVLGDSHADPQRMEPHGDRPEIREALRTGRGESTRWSDTVSRTMKYVAFRVGPEDHPLGVVRVAMGVRALSERTRALYALLGPLGGIGLVASVGLAIGLAVLWSGRIRRITAAAQRLSRGDLRTPLDARGRDEVAMLARSMNRMRDRIAMQIETIDRQRRSLDSLIGQLNEGVIVADAAGRITLMNPAAARFLGVPTDRAPSSSVGPAPVELVIPHHDLQELLLPDRRRTEPNEDAEPDHGTEVEARIAVAGPRGPIHLLARATDVTLPAGDPPHAAHGMERPTGEGRLLVLTDITELTRAVRMRSDFVANASHELRTPLSAIRGAIETLTRMDLREETDAARRFLGVVARHSAHLEALVTDLLDLSRVESPSVRFETGPLHVQRVADELRARWDEALRAKNLRWRGGVGEGCSTVQANPHLLKLVLDNLVDNAIKFTEPGGEIGLACRCGDDEVILEISDTGCGIAPEHHERVFERFFQVAADRSETASPAGERRGTGLGLSIVRHAVTAMGGTVRLHSAPGVGTRVSIALPTASRTIPLGLPE